MDNSYYVAYIDKIKSGKKTFYYLGKTIRIRENKWKKIRIKLGEKKPTKEEVRKKLNLMLINMERLDLLYLLEYRFQVQEYTLDA